MTETQIGLTACLGLVGLVITCVLWMLGGRKGKWKRRYVGSAIMSTTVIALCVLMNKFDPWLLVLYVTLAVSYSMGYGGDDLWEKTRRRSLFVLGNLASGAVLMVVLGVPFLWIPLIHLGVSLWTIPLGISSSIHAASEEVFVCALLNIMLLAYPFIV